MSWQSMSLEIAGVCPVPFNYALTLVNRAWLEVQREFLWSFLWGDAAIPTPTPITTGSCTLSIGSNQVILDANATAALSAVGLASPNPLTTRQFRIGQGTIYSINAYDTTTNAPFGTLTLNQIYVDPMQGAGIGYQVIGVYYNAPTSDFLWWESVRDPISGYGISSTLTREEVDIWDPQRFQAGWPKGVLPYKINPQPGNFANYPMFEMWPAPQQGYTYVGTYYRSGLPFTLPTDTVAAPLGEDVVIAQAKIRAYEWCVANPDKVPHAPGSQYRAGATGFQFLMGSAQAELKELLNGYILKDETFSNRHMIADLPKDVWAQLPWVSMKAGVMANV